MKRFLALALPLLLALAPGARADGPDDDYVGIYNTIQQADALNEVGQVGPARTRYSEALKNLQKFQTNYPDWNTKVVRYRLNYLSTKIGQIDSTLTTPAAPSTPTPAAPPVPQATPQPATPGATPATTPTPEAIPEVAANQIRDLQEQLRHSEAERSLLQSKLKEALNSQPPAIDPQELAKAQDQIKELQKENDLLKVSLADARTNAVKADSTALDDATKKIAELTKTNSALSAEKASLLAQVKTMNAPDDATTALRAENDVLKKEVADLKSHAPASNKVSDLNRKLLEAQSQVAALQSDKEIMRLEKVALENRLRNMSNAPIAIASAPASASLAAAPAIAASDADDKIRRLEEQRDELQKSLDAATRELQGRKGSKQTTADRIAEMTHELATLHARIDALESRQVPYTEAELALLKPDANTILSTSARPPSRKSARELPEANAKLLAQVQHLMDTGELEKAEAACNDLLKLDPRDVMVLGLLAQIQLDLLHWTEAEKHLHDALAIEPDQVHCLFVLGELRFRQKKFDEAIDALSRAAQLDDNNAQVQNFLGLAFAEKGLRGPAETALRKAVQLYPGFADAHNNLAIVYLSQKPPLVELARWHYQKALATGHARNLQLEQMIDSTAHASTP